jgi:Leu/Phe-tRNA-protein transferase
MSATANVVTNVNSIVISWTIVAKEGNEISVVATLTEVNALRGTKLVEEQRVHGETGEKATGTSEFHFLKPGTKYNFELKLGSIDGSTVLQLTAETPRTSSSVKSGLARQIRPDMWQTFVGEEHTLGQWLSDSPEDMVWTAAPISYDLMCSLWRNACFTLPNTHNPIVSCPNPVSRYCLDLKQDIPWLRSKKVKRHKKDFSLSVNADYAGTFVACEHNHSENNRGRWITPELVTAMDRCRKEDGEVKMYSIELWEKETGKLAAAIMALSVGDVFHDYTTAAMIRDSRSAGAILTKVVGHLLHECGFTLWYWGFKNPYMAEYDQRYGGVLLDNKTQFWPKWRQALSGVSADGQPYPGPQSFTALVLSKAGTDGRIDLADLNGS